MEQKRTAPRAQKTQPLTYREWKRRKQLRLARNWGLFLAGCALVVFLTLFPYTTLFRSIGRASCRERV